MSTIFTFNIVAQWMASKNLDKTIWFEAKCNKISKDWAPYFWINSRSYGNTNSQPICTFMRDIWKEIKRNNTKLLCTVSQEWLHQMHWQGVWFAIYRGIHADIIVYIFAHLHMTLLTEGNIPDTNWLQVHVAKELVKLNTWWNFVSLGVTFKEILSFKDCKNSGGQKQ